MNITRQDLPWRRAAVDTLDGPAIHVELAGHEDPTVMVRSVASNGSALYAEVEQRAATDPARRMLWTWDAGRWRSVRAIGAGDIACGPGQRLWQWSGRRCTFLSDGSEVPVEGAPAGLDWLIRSAFVDESACWAVAQLSTRHPEVHRYREGWFRWREETHVRLVGAGAIIMRLDGGRWRIEWQNMPGPDPYHAGIPSELDGVPGGTGPLWAVGGNGVVLRRARATALWSPLAGMNVPGDDANGAHRLCAVAACADGTAIIVGKQCVRRGDDVIEDIGCVRTLGLDTVLKTWRSRDGANWFVAAQNGRPRVLRHEGRRWSDTAVEGWDVYAVVGAVPEGERGVLLVNRGGQLCRLSV